jgi:hypothetical protein
MMKNITRYAFWFACAAHWFNCLKLSIPTGFLKKIMLIFHRIQLLG